MSVRALTAAFDSPYGDQAPGRRLVLIALADAAQDDGVTWISQPTLAAKAKVSEQTVRAALRELEEQGIVETRKAPRGRTRINVYRYVYKGVAEVDYERLPFDLEDEFTTASELRVSEADDRNSASLTTATDLRPRARGSLPLTNRKGTPNQVPPVVPPDNRPAKADGKPVTDAEYELAAQILVEFNQQTGTTYRAKGHIATIILRIREHPELTIEHHAAVIARTLAEPFWRGAPEPRLIYGNDQQFERCVLSVKVAPKERGMTPEEIEQAGREQPTVKSRDPWEELGYPGG